MSFDVTCIIIDNFYAYPDKVREFALEQKFDVEGNYPGLRTKPFFTDQIKESIEHVMSFAGKITNTFGSSEDSGYCGAFQITTAKDRTWIHSDPFNMWAGVCYLSPDPPLSGGTGLFRYKETGESIDINKENKYSGLDITKWEMVDRIGNKYNRLVIYRGDLFHASLDYFGDNINNGRLFQTFFFDTEKRV